MFGNARDEGSYWRGWPDVEGPYEVGLHFREIDGRSELVGVELWSGGAPLERHVRGMAIGQPGDAGPLPAVALRQLPIGRLVDMARGRGVDGAKLVMELFDPQYHPREQLERAERTFRFWQASRGRGGRKPSYEPGHYSEVARVYTTAWRNGLPPTKAVATWGSVQHSTAAKWVAKARALGLLPPTTKGRPSIPAVREPERRPSKEDSG